MPRTQAQRLAAFAGFVRRALNSAFASGLTVADIEARTTVGKTTFYRWANNQLKRPPRVDQVHAFCDGLGIERKAATGTLGWSEPDKRKATADTQVLPSDIQAILQKLRDPNVPPREKYLIKETLRSLAARTTTRTDRAG